MYVRFNRKRKKWMDKRAIRGGEGAQTPNGKSSEKFPFYFWDTLPY